MPYRKNVYILGAGSSAAAGAPVMRDFLDRAQNLYLNPKSGLSQSDRDRFGMVFAWRKRMDLGRAHVEMDLDNIEDLFGLVDLQCRIGNREAREVRDCLTFLIKRTLQALTRTNFAEVDMLHYWGFAQIACRTDDVIVLPDGPNEWNRADNRRDTKDAIITLNYDLLVEHALKPIDRLPHYALDDSKPVAQSVPVLKLHGSINWRICEVPGCQHIVVQDPRDPSEACPKALHHKTVPFIVPPTWDKGAGNQAIERIWAAAHDELATAHRWIIIGYSAPPSDRFFQYLLGSAVAANEHLEIVAVLNYGATDSAREATRQRYQAMFTSAFAGRRLDLRLERQFPNETLDDIVGLVCPGRLGKSKSRAAR